MNPTRMETIKVTTAAGSNAVLAGANWFVTNEPVVHSLLAIAQIAVAVITVVYIAQKVIRPSCYFWRHGKCRRANSRKRPAK